MTGLAVLTDDLAGALQLARQALVRADDLVERIGDFSSQPRLVAREPDREITLAYRLQRPQELAQIEAGAVHSLLAIGFQTTTRTYLRFHQRTPEKTVTK